MSGPANRFDPRRLLSYQALIFDLDGTLVNLGIDWGILKKKLSAHLLSRTGENLSFSPLDQKLSYVRSKYDREVFDELMSIVSDFEMRDESYRPNNALIEFLNSSDIRYAIYSMNTRKCVYNFVNKFLARKPDMIIAKEDCSEPKPTNLDIDRIINFWQMNKKNVMLVGDSPGDKESAKRSHIKFLKI